MTLPFNLQKLPSEALDVIRYLDKTPSATVAALETGTGIASRTIGKAIRRLVNYDYIQMDSSGAYQLTTDGKLAARQITDYDMAGPRTVDKAETVKVKRHLSIVMPKSAVTGKSSDLYVGVNPPDAAGEKLPAKAQLELKISAVGATLSSNNVSLEVPPDKAATPGKVTLTPLPNSKMIHLRVDVYQAFEYDSMEPLEKIYFDLQVQPDAAGAGGTMAKGADVMLRPPR